MVAGPSVPVWVRRTILDIPETRADLWSFLQTHAQARLAAGDAKVALIAEAAVSAGTSAP